MNKTSNKDDHSASLRRLVREGLRPWRSLAILALTGLLAGLALVQVPGSDVSAATLETSAAEESIDQRAPGAQGPEGAFTPSPEVSEALPFL